MILKKPKGAESETRKLNKTNYKHAWELFHNGTITQLNMTYVLFFFLSYGSCTRTEVTGYSFMDTDF